MIIEPFPEEIGLVGLVWYPGVLGVEGWMGGRYPVGPELLAEPAVPLPSDATHYHADAVDVYGVEGGVRTLVLAGAAEWRCGEPA